MRPPTLIVSAHPVPESFNAALTHAAVMTARGTGAEVRHIDLYGEAFDPVLSLSSWQGHLDAPETKPELADHVDALRWARRLVLVYPTWWSGPPAILKGWFDRVWMHGVAFELPPDAGAIRGLLDLEEIVVITTHGSGRIRNLVQGQGGRRMILRGLRALAGWRCRTRWVAMYNLDRAGELTRAEFVERVSGVL